MAGRCGCSSSNATGASISAGACVTVSGAGTTASPAVIGVEVDPDASNNLQCSTNGLYSSQTQIEADDDSIIVTGDGSGASPYGLSVQLGPDAPAAVDGHQLLTLIAGQGLVVDSQPINVGFLDNAGVLAGGGIGDPQDTFLKVQGGTDIVALDVNGNGTVTFPTPFPTNLVSFVAGNGDANTPAFSVALGGVPSLGAHQIHCEPLDVADPVASTNVRITWIAIGD